MGSYCSDCGQPLASAAGYCAGCGAAVIQRQPGAAFGSAQQGGYPPQPSYDRDYARQPGYAYRPSRDVTGIGWMVEPLRRYADFNGRSRRTEYWMFALLQVIVYVLCFGMIIAGMPWGELESNPDAEPSPIAILGILLIALWWLVTFIPSLAVKVRRLHDSDKSGWLVLLFVFLTFLLSIIGWVVQAVFMLLEGTRGPNQYGDDPKGGDTGEIFR